jgi:Undecaprenyl-phosphate glucose phosphotransferase
MAIGYSRYLHVIYAFGDIIVLNLALLINRLLYDSTPISFREADFIQILFLNFIWLSILYVFRMTDMDRSKPSEEIFSGLARSFLFYILITFSLTFAFSRFIKPAENYLIFYLLFGLLLFIWRAAMLRLLRFVRTRGLNFRRVVIAGHGPMAVSMYRFFQTHPELGYRFLGAFYNSDHTTELPRTDTLERLPQFAIDHSVDEIYCSSSSLEPDQIASLVRFCDRHLIRFKLIPDFRGLLQRRVIINFYNNIPVISLRNEPLEQLSNRLVKRAFDVVFSLVIILLIISWLIPLLAVLIKISSPGPVFFRQKRSGLKNVQFTCLKLRTMRVNDEADERQATRDDPRTTPIGKWLRKTNLDELPQFFNVLMGQMSVVGPRPHMLRHTEEYSRMFDQFMVRHLVKPGITGWAQVNGYRGETINPERMRKRVEHDVWYIENWSLMLDLKIIYLTIEKMFTGDKHAV